MSADDPVRAQYEALPYPERDPADEARRLLTGSPSLWPEVVHTLFAGRAPTGKPERPVRILVAGGGTGDALVMLAQQTADAGVAAEIVNLDLSETSSAVARARIAARGLSARVTFVRDDLRTAPAHGPFDYIDCCGVLHHLPDPAEGFRALAEALAPRGGIGLMVYGEFGRTGVYELQEALRHLAPAADAPGERLDAARRVLQGLPATNRFRRNPLMRDHLDSDAGLFDLLLHSTDRAYRADALMAELEAAGLRLVRWVDPLRYDPALYLPDPDLRAKAAALPPAARAALAEALAGNMRKHIAYAVPAERAEPVSARPAPDMIPVFRDAETAAQFRAMPADARALPVEIDGLNLKLPLPEGAAALIAEIDGRRSLEKIRKRLPGRPDKAAFHALFEGVWHPLNGVSKLFLKR